MADKSKQDSMQRFLNNARKKALNIEGKSTSIDVDKQVTDDRNKKEDKDWLTKKALEEIERNAKIHKVKRESGLSTDEPKSKTNKRFLHATLSNALRHNERKVNTNLANSSNKLKELERYHRLKNSKEKFGERKFFFKKPKNQKESDDSSD